MKKLRTGMKDIKICNTDQSNIVDTVKDSCQIVLGHAKISRLDSIETNTLEEVVSRYQEYLTEEH